MEGDKKNNIEEIKQKALKITEALYRTTDLFYDVEPLKWSLRETSLSILEIVSGIEGKSEYERSREIEKLNNLVKKLFLKLELASSGTFISRTNFDVLEREYIAIGQSLKRSFIPTLLLDKPLTDIVSDSLSDNVSVTDNSNVIRHEEVSRPAESEPTGIIVERGDPKRKETILEALKTKGPSSVSDLAGLFAGAISEKTVQRELSSLVAAGNVKQEGEKRWRRYFL